MTVYQLPLTFCGKQGEPVGDKRKVTRICPENGRFADLGSCRGEKSYVCVVGKEPRKVEEKPERRCVGGSQVYDGV
jgi:hypothetical protein